MTIEWTKKGTLGLMFGELDQLALYRLSSRSFCLPEYEAQVLHNKIYTGQKTNITVNINALKLASRLKKYVKNHVTYIESDVVSVNRNEYGDVTSLLLKNGVEHSSDFFIDCTGFKSMLKKPRRMDLIKSGRLFVNTAVAGTVSYENESVEMTPFAICPAVDQGWVWKIPTQGRIGSGLVFNRDITSVEDAKVKFSNYWNGRVNPDDLKVIDWTPYYENNIWDRNVCSIGLSAGFMEPLESTGIGGTIESIKALAASCRKDSTIIGPYMNTTQTCTCSLKMSLTLLRCTIQSQSMIVHSGTGLGKAIPRQIDSCFMRTS